MTRVEPEGFGSVIPAGVRRDGGNSCLSHKTGTIVSTRNGATTFGQNPNIDSGAIFGGRGNPMARISRCTRFQLARIPGNFSQAFIRLDT